MATVSAPSQGVSSSPQVLGNFQTLLILQTNSLKTSAHRCKSRLENAPLPAAAVKARDLLDLCWPGLETRERAADVAGLELLTASLQNV